MVEVHNKPNLSCEFSKNVDDIQQKQNYQTAESLKNRLFKFRTKVVWINVISFIILHIFGIYGAYKVMFFRMKIPTSIFSIVFVYCYGLSVTAGAHRLWAHKTYKAKTPLKIMLLLGQTAAGQNSVWEWSRDHRLHHKYTDTDADPHNSNRGFFFSHIGWLMMKKHPDIKTIGKTIDMSDLDADYWVMFQRKYYKTLYFLIGVFIPCIVPIIFWDETFANVFLAYLGRYVVSLNITWCVNSVAHFYGMKPYTKDIRPVESRFVSFLTGGEGWHNYHHTFPWDYKASEFGNAFTFSTAAIEFFERLGLAYDLKSATQEMVNHRIENKGDGSSTIFLPSTTKKSL